MTHASTSISTPTTGPSAEVSDSSTDTFDEPQFRDTAGHYASGITIITGHDSEGPTGFTCQSFYSVSVDPPLVSFSVMKTSTTYPRIRDTGAFAVNILSAGQGAISGQFARRGSDKWAGITWHPTRGGNPVLDGTLAWLDCTIHAEHDAGDHVIVIGRVTGLGTPHTEQPGPLLYFKSRYRTLLAPSSTSP
ncbi:flavin reductase family protein [Arthrobacter sp. Soc17.1.1.1]|uniref:flavin reductase family protein n=1 Tax=Arthrobacter sp. Soc17.1.1.1 TaxID=3121277 RepID=UPI002FE45E0F